MGVDEDEDEDIGAVADGVVDGGYRAAIGSSFYISAGCDTEVEANRGVAANDWDGDGSVEEEEDTAKFGTGLEK